LNSAVFYNDGETKTAKNDPNYDSEDHPVIWTNVDATFNNISVISRGSVLLVEDTGEPRENYWPVASH
jgi:hypothetical protein